jgi:hypothetical protein
MDRGAAHAIREQADQGQALWVPKNSPDLADLELSALIAPANMWELGGNSVGTGQAAATSPPW